MHTLIPPVFWVVLITSLDYLESASPTLRLLGLFWCGIAIGRCLRLIFAEK